MRALIVNAYPLLEEALRLLIRRLSREAEVLTATGLDAAHGSLEGGAVDWAIVDLDCWTLPGVLMLRELRERHPDVGLISLSARQDRATLRAVTQLGVSGHLPKLAPLGVITESLEEILNSRHPVSHETERGIEDPHGANAQTAADGPSAAPCRPLALTQRQREVLGMLLLGQCNKNISRALAIEPSTVKVHVSAILRALKVRTRTQAVITARGLGIEASAPQLAAPLTVHAPAGLNGKRLHAEPPSAAPRQARFHAIEPL